MTWSRSWVAVVQLGAAIAAVAVIVASTVTSGGRVNAQEPHPCAGCHLAQVDAVASGKHASIVAASPAALCATCHEGTQAHLDDAAVPKDPALYPRVHFDKEQCATCHADQYNSFLIVDGGKTFYGGSDPGSSAHPAPKGWSKTADLPYWNVLIDGHPFVLETYEDRPMAVNQIEHQETIRPGSESCMACHGTKLAYYMGIQFRDGNGQLQHEGMQKTPSGLFVPREVLIKAGTYVPPAATDAAYPRGGTWNNPPSTPGAGHLIYDGTSYRNQTGGAWEEAVTVTFIPNGTRISTYIDAVDPLVPYQVKTLVTLPAPVTDTVPNVSDLGKPVQAITFQTVSSYPESGADINGVTGCTPGTAVCASASGVANVARNWAYAAMEAMAFDGLDYEFDALVPSHSPVASGAFETHFSGRGTNWPSIQSGQLCNQCHDPMSAKPRIIKKSLIEAIAVRGINPYSPTGSQVHTFAQASRQDQIVAQCAQCHSEYVGGYSANDGRDRDYFPWAKPTDLEALYWGLFDYLQDWTHGGPVAPWQSRDSNARGFTPYGQRYPINAPLVKVQHPEAEMFLNSPMYNAGATCTDCHSTRVTRADGTRYTSHWFTSPLKIMNGYTGTTFKGDRIAGDPITIAPQNPCAKCHTTDTPAQSLARIKDQQDIFFSVQERTQVALVNALKFINAQPAGPARAANVQTYQRAAMRWEYYTQAENSMGFHNNPEAVTEVASARLAVDAFVPWPLTPVNVRAASVGTNSLTLAFYDQASDETAFIVERAPALEGPYVEVARIATTNGANEGDVEWTDAGVGSATTYFYRVAALNAAGTSVYSIWAKATTLGVAVTPPADLVATAASSSRIDLRWGDQSANETGFHVERARDADFTVGLAAFDVAAGVTAFADIQLAPATTYYYRVFAVAAAGTSAASNTASAMTLAAPPAVPGSLTVTAVARDSIGLAWRDNSGDETGFSVERRRNGDPTWVRVATLPAGSVAYTNGGLARRTTYSYRVQAFNALGSSPFSNIVSAKTR